jgi:hypothetical protein
MVLEGCLLVGLIMLGTHSHVGHPPGVREGTTLGVWVAMQTMSAQGGLHHLAETWRVAIARQATRRVRRDIMRAVGMDGRIGLEVLVSFL